MDNPDLTHTDLYKVTFFGNTTNNQNRSIVAKRFAAAFNLRDSKALKKLFSGKAITLKKGLTHDQAHRYGQIMMEMGADCCIEPEAKHFAINKKTACDKQRKLEKKRQQQMAASSVTKVNQLSLAPLDTETSK